MGHEPKSDCGCAARERQRFDRTKWQGPEAPDLLSQLTQATLQETTLNPAPGRAPSQQGSPLQRTLDDVRLTTTGGGDRVVRCPRAPWAWPRDNERNPAQAMSFEKQ